MQWIKFGFRCISCKLGALGARVFCTHLGMLQYDPNQRCFVGRMWIASEMFDVQTRFSSFPRACRFQRKQTMDGGFRFWSHGILLTLPKAQSRQYSHCRKLRADLRLRLQGCFVGCSGRHSKHGIPGLTARMCVAGLISLAGLSGNLRFGNIHKKDNSTEPFLFFS